MTLSDVLSVAGDVATVATAIVAVGTSLWYLRDRDGKRRRLEACLAGEVDGSGTTVIFTKYTPLELAAALGMTEAEVIHAAFGSKRIERSIRVNEATGRADMLFLSYAGHPAERAIPRARRTARL